MDNQTLAEDVAWFCRQVRTRSREHRDAMPIAAQHGWVSVMVGLLRQELDSLVRVVYLLHQQDLEKRAQLLGEAVSGKRWKRLTRKGGLTNVTEAEMVELADVESDLQGWTKLVYRFGCSFIHLSYLHDYLARDPFRALPGHDRQAIATLLLQHYGGQVSAESSFDEVTPYIPKVLNKIASSQEGYLRDLERTTLVHL